MSSYSGAPTVKEARDALSAALAALQDESIGTLDASVTRNVAQAVGGLLDAEKASTEREGVASVKSALELLSRSRVLLDEVRSPSRAIDAATESVARAARLLFPLTAPAAAAGGSGAALDGDSPGWTDETVRSEPDPGLMPSMRSTTEIVVGSPIDQVAARLLDFTGLHRWHPGLEDVRVEGSGVGAVRSYLLGEHRFRERLDAVDDERGLSYSVLEGPLPVTNLSARYELIGDAGATRVVWSAEGDAPAELAEGMAAAAAALQNASLMFLKIVCEEGVDLVPPSA